MSRIIAVAMLLWAAQAAAKPAGWHIHYYELRDGMPYDVTVIVPAGHKPFLKDIHVNSIQVKSGARFAAYDRPNYRGRKTILTSSWSAGPKTWPEIRSLRVLRAPDIARP